MKYYADFHIHSKYSIATSKKMEIESIAKSAKCKGINLMGTGDFTNPGWLYELENNLEETGKFGIYNYEGVDFILTGEVNTVFNDRGNSKKIHSLIMLPDFTSVRKFNKEIRRYGKLESDGRPTLSISLRELTEILFSVYDRAILIPAHLWTPWYGLFGSKSGYDSLNDAFGNYADDIYAIETGLSSDPPMNWMLSPLDRMTLVSNSDAHSPVNIGREANCFNSSFDFLELREILKEQDSERFLYTVEFFPEEGKYHYDGHRKCGITLHPEEAEEHDNICPECGKPLTLGVLHRVYTLGDRDEPRNKGRIGYKRLIPLREILSDKLGVGTKTKRVNKAYNKLTSYFGSEFKILMDVDPEDIKNTTDRETAGAIINVRKEEVEIEPGFDGVYGKINVMGADEVRENRQQSLF